MSDSQATGAEDCARGTCTINVKTASCIYCGKCFLPQTMAYMTNQELADAIKATRDFRWASSGEIATVFQQHLEKLLEEQHRRATERRKSS